MKKVGIKWGIFVIVFIVSLIISNFILNKGTTDMTMEMQEATLPVISVIYDNRPVNTMHGFTVRMDNGTVRDSISPIGEDRTLSFVINNYGVPVTKVAYEVRSVDGSRLIENTNVGNYEKQKGNITASISLRDLIEDKKEYNLCFILTLQDGKEAYYYTRIIRDEIEVSPSLDFVFDFNRKTFDVDDVKDIYKYIEPNSDSDNTTLATTNIHNSRAQLGWGNLMPVRQGEATAVIHEIDGSTASISLDYMVSIRDGNIGNLYRVYEFYKIRHSADRFYLLGFDRSVEQIFVPGKEAFSENKINLGIQGEDNEFLESDDGNIFAFVNAGRLYSYDISENKLATLYSYYEAGDTDVRNIYDKSRIKLLNVEENGNVSFIVYGYFNRGIHEGHVGVAVEYYNSLLNTVEELIFVEYDKSPEVLLCDVSKIAYLNNFNTLYLYIDGNIMQYDMDKLTESVVSDSVREETLFVSESNNSAVWLEGTAQDIDADLQLLDLKDGYQSAIDKKKTECIQAIGFMNEDLIYGISHVDDVVYNPFGDITFPMARIVISSEYGGVLKEYEFDNMYVTEGTIEKNRVRLKRVSKNEDGTFSETTDDQITNNETGEEGRNKIDFVTYGDFETVAQIVLKKSVEVKNLKLLTPKEVLTEGGKTVDYSQPQNGKNRYYMYYNGHITDISDEAGKNVNTACENRATIVDTYGNEIYKRAQTVVRNQIMAIKEENMSENASYMAECLNTILNHRSISRNTEYMLNRGDTPMDILQNNLKDVQVLNLTGCDENAVFYYLNRDIPVLAITDEGNPVLLIGYNELNLVWYDPSTRSIYKKGIKDSAQIFEDAGNRFMTYSINTVN